MKPLKLIYFKGCPTAEKIKSVLGSREIPFIEILQCQLPEGDEHQKFSSPTLLQDEQLIFGSVTGNAAACTASDFKWEYIMDKVTSSKKENSKLAAFGAGGSLGIVSVIGLCGGACAVGSFALAPLLAGIGLGFLSPLLPAMRIPLLAIGFFLGAYYIFQVAKRNKPAQLVLSTFIFTGVFAFSGYQALKANSCSSQTDRAGIDKIKTETKKVVRSIYLLWPDLGRAPTLAEVADHSSFSHEDVAAAYQDLRKAGLADMFVGDSDTIRWFWPFSSVDHGIRVTIKNKKTIFARCSLDALGVSSMFKSPVEISAFSTLDKTPLSFRVDNETLLQGDKDVIVTRGEEYNCDQMLFFANRDEFARYKQIYGLKVLKGFPLVDGLKFGVRAFKDRIPKI